MNAHNTTHRPRSYLFLQGMATGFFRKLGRALSGRGHAVRRITFNGGDLVFWPGAEGAHYRGSLEDFPAFLAPKLDDWGITDIILFGDCRPLHRRAIELAKGRNIVVHVIEEGYLRPNWVTVEAEGVNGHSALPKDPEWYVEAARDTPAWTGGEPVVGSFRRRALEDVAYNVASVVLSPLYPGYRTHRPWHPFVEYAGWLKQLASKDREQALAERAVAELLGGKRPYYLHPLQLDCDSQIRHHSSFGRIAPALEHVIASFARAAPSDALLLVKEHPLDNGLQDWRKLSGRMATAHGIEGRLVYIVGGDLEALLHAAQGVVTVNSTVGFVALSFEKPVMTLGEAIYDMPQMTFQGDLDAFWSNGQPPRPDLFDAFRRVVAARTQVNGGFFSESALNLAVCHAVERVENAPPPVLARVSRQQRKAALPVSG